jgi:lambda family phage portal protein
MQRFDPDVEALIGPPANSVVAIGGAYDGASRFDRDLTLWSPPLQTADMDILPDKDLSEARVRDTLRNDAYVQGGQTLHRDNIVGSMFLLNCKPELRVLNSKACDEKWAGEFQEEVEAKFTLWAESPNNWPDAARMNTLTALTRLAVGVYCASGEVIATAEWMRDQPRPFQTAIQMIEGERLSTPYDLSWDNRVRGGIERNAYGAPQAYHIRNAHPSDYSAGADAFTWTRVPIRKRFGRLNVIHIVEQMRIDQSRGISEMVSALKEMKITKKFRDVTLQNAVVNATYAASIESDMPPEAAFAAIGGVGGGEIGKGATDFAAEWLRALAAYTGGSKNLQMDGVKIPHLFPGTKLQLRNAGTPGGVGTEFEQSLLRYIAANLGVSYEQLSRDYSQTNYSSVRAAMNETLKFMTSRKRMVADRFASAVYRLWFEEALGKGEITTLTRSMPDYYAAMNADAYTNCDWIGAGRGQVDELKETQASVLKLKYNLSTYEDEMARLGKDWRKTLAQREREQAEMKLRGLVIEEDNGINAASGTPSTATDPKTDDGDKRANDGKKKAA